MKCQRFFVSDVAKMTGLHPATIRNLTKRGLIKAQRDWNGWRVYAPEDIEKLNKLAGVKSEKDLRDAEAGRR